MGSRGDPSPPSRCNGVGCLHTVLAHAVVVAWRDAGRLSRWPIPADRVRTGGARPHSEAARAGLRAAGVYTAELPSWRVTFRVADGWRLNGYDGPTSAPTRDASVHRRTRASCSWMIRACSTTLARPQSVQALTIPAHSWLSFATGVTVGAVEPVSAGANGSSFPMRMSTASPLCRLFALPSSGTFVPAIPSWTGHVAQSHSTGGHELIVATAGASDRRHPSRRSYA